MLSVRGGGDDDRQEVTSVTSLLRMSSDVTQVNPNKSTTNNTPKPATAPSNLLQRGSFKHILSAVEEVQSTILFNSGICYFFYTAKKEDHGKKNKTSGI